MAQLGAFQFAQAKDIEIPEMVCFEKISDRGGQWNYTWRTKTDKDGEAIQYIAASIAICGQMSRK